MVNLVGRQISTFEDLEKLYRSRISKLGMSSELLFYRNSEQHLKKLRAVSDLLSAIDEISNLSLLEVGCGYGALLETFRPGPRYLGIDIVPEFVAEARKRFPSHRFEIGNFLDRDDRSFELVVLAGVLSGVPQPREMLERALHVAQLGVIFDVTLHGRLPPDFVDLNRWSVDELFGIASECGYAELAIRDSAASWILCFARKPASP